MIQRWKLDPFDGEGRYGSLSGMEPSPDGEYILYSDHLRAMEELNKSLHHVMEALRKAIAEKVASTPPLFPVAEKWKP